MLISDIFKPQNIKLNLESEDKDELFEELINFLVDAEGLDNREDLLESLWERERKMTTGIAPNIAIPHTKMKDMEQIYGAIGISRQGIEYESLDGKPAHLIMLLIGNEDKPEEHLQVLKKMAMLLSNNEFYNRIMKCGSETEITEIIAEFEEI